MSGKVYSSKDLEHYYIAILSYNFEKHKRPQTTLSELENYYKKH